jgi:hypothetical protein
VLFLHDGANPFAAGRVQDAPVADAERDVVAVADEVATAEVAFRDRLAYLLLLVGVAGDETAEVPIGHVHEPGQSIP